MVSPKWWQHQYIMNPRTMPKLRRCTVKTTVKLEL